MDSDSKRKEGERKTEIGKEGEGERGRRGGGGGERETKKILEGERKPGKNDV